MKHYSLKRAIECAEKLGLLVTRKHSDGDTYVKVEAADKMQSEGRRYRTGNASAQARFIKSAAKGFTLVEKGMMVRGRDGRIMFISTKYRNLYQWKESAKAWQMVLRDYRVDDKYLRLLFAGRWCHATVKVDKLQSGVYYY